MRLALACLLVASTALAATFSMTPGKITVDSGGKPSTFSRPAEYLDPLRRTPLATWRIAGIPVTLDYQRLTYGKRVIYDFADDIARSLADATAECAEHIHTEPYLPLSLVGTVVSYQKVEAGSGACGPPGFWAGVRAVDGGDGQPALLGTYFEEDSLIAALREDRFVRAPAKARTLTDLKKHLRASFHFLPEDPIWNHFAILAYDEKKNLATVRFAVPGDIKAFEQLGLRLRPRAAFRAALREAARGSGFFLDRFTAGGKRDSLGSYLPRRR